MQKTKRGGGGGIIQGFRLHLARLLLLLLLCSRCLCREQTTEAHQVALVNRNRSAQCLQRVSLFIFFNHGRLVYISKVDYFLAMCTLGLYTTTATS